MTKNSVQELSEKLQAKLQIDRQAVENLTRQQLTQHESSLKKLSDSALITTKVVMQQHHAQLKLLNSQAFQHLKLLMLWPLIATIALCLLMLVSAFTYSLLIINQADETVQQRQVQIKQLEANFCASPAGQRICKPKG